MADLTLSAEAFRFSTIDKPATPRRRMGQPMNYSFAEITPDLSEISACRPADDQSEPISIGSVYRVHLELRKMIIESYSFAIDFRFAMIAIFVV
jgi:hypothetical protein